MNTAQDTRAAYTLAALDADILAQAEAILRRRYERQGDIGNPKDAADFLRMRLGGLDHEEFHVVHLDNRHRIIAVEGMFRGTVDGASIHPREVVKAALHHNACAVMFAHNHPSGVPEPSAADRAITRELVQALGLVGVRVLDHFVIGETCVSFAERGLL